MVATVLLPLLAALLVVAGLVAVIALVWALIRYVRAQEEARRAAWKKLALQAGLTSNADCTSMAGRDGALSISLDRKSQTTMAGTTPVVTYYHLLTITGLPHDVRLAGEGMLTGLFRGPDLELGDPDFDDAVRLDGDPDRLLALLDGRTRGLALTVTRAGGTVDGGQLVLRKDALPEAETRAALALARVLSSREEAHVRLPRTARSETHPTIRRRQLARALAMEGVDRTELATEALSWEPGCRLEAARFLGDEEVLRDLARNPSASAAIRAEAALALGTPDVEATLITALQDDLPDPRRLEVVRALGDHGSVAAVEVLMRQGRGGPIPDALRKEARAAIRAIQDRAGVSGANVGGLTLSESTPDAGGLSVAMDGGELSAVPLRRETAAEGVESEEDRPRHPVQETERT